MNAPLALYREYIGSQREATDTKMHALAQSEEDMQSVIDSLPPGRSQFKWRVENWDTGETILTF